MSERWPTSRVAEYLGLGSPNAARTQLSRWGIGPVGRQPGAKGENLYDAARVRAAKEGRLGRGARTDLRRRQDSSGG